MAGVSETRVLDAVLSSTLASYGKKLQDQIFDSYPFLSYLNGKLGNAMRNGKSIKRTVEGGESITEALLYGRNSTAASYAGAESLSTVLQDGITTAQLRAA